MPAVKFLDIKLTDIIAPDSNNMRSSVDAKRIEELAANLQKRGLIQPVVVMPEVDGKYRLVCGFRRYKAATKIGWETITAKIDEDEANSDLTQLTENFDREDVTPYDTGRQIKKIMDKHGWTASQVGEHLGKSASWVSSYLGIFDLPEKVQTKVKEGSLGISQVSMLHGMLKSLSPSQLTRFSNKVTELSQDELQDLRQKVLERADPTRAAKEAKAKSFKASLQPRSGADGVPECYSNMRTRPQLEELHSKLSAKFDGSESKTEREQILIQVDTLDWVLGDDDVNFGVE